MQLTLSTTHSPATDLGYLLHKNPAKFQTFSLTFGKAYVFYPEASDERCSACLLLEIDPVALVRGKNDSSFVLAQYVNDRPYVASSFLSVAINQIYRSAMQGTCKDRPELVSTPIPLEARLEALRVRGGEAFLRGVFEPLGYEVEAQGMPLDPTFPEWGLSPYFRVVLRKATTLAEILAHLYVLIPVFDTAKHYFIGDDELEKLLAKGEGWLAAHPQKEAIARRYLGNRSGLYREALSRLTEEVTLEEEEVRESREEILEKPLSLHQQRHEAVLAELKEAKAATVIDFGCGEGRLLRELIKEKSIEKIVGVEVSVQALQLAERRLKLDRMPEKQAAKLQLLQGSLMYRDQRLAGYDAAAVVEVIEHLDPPRLASFERVLFEFTRPRVVVITTPNRDYNAFWPTLSAGAFRHPDHRFEWTRQEFADWVESIVSRFGYQATIKPLGPVEVALGAPSQMAVFLLTPVGDVAPGPSAAASPAGSEAEEE